MKLEWLPRPRAAIAIGAKLEASLARLADFPSSGRIGRVVETRELVVPDTPFVVVYRIETSAVVILRVLHAAQHYPPKG